MNAVTIGASDLSKGRGGKFMSNVTDSASLEEENDGLLREAIVEGLQDIERGDYYEVRRDHIDEDISALFRTFRKA